MTRRRSRSMDAAAVIVPRPTNMSATMTYLAPRPAGGRDAGQAHGREGADDLEEDPVQGQVGHLQQQGVASPMMLEPMKATATLRRTVEGDAPKASVSGRPGLGENRQQPGPRRLSVMPPTRRGRSRPTGMRASWKGAPRA